MKEQVMFSIITPCFNSEKTIKRTLESVLNQTCQDYEYIIIDGGSTDKTLNIIKSYKPFFKEKLKVVSEKDDGIYDAMNKGIYRAQGEIIGIINSDDYYENNALENILQYYDKKKKYQILYGMMRIINAEEQELSIVFYHHRNLNNQIINHPSSFVTSKLYKELGTYNTDYKSVSDYDFMLKMAQNEKVVFTPVYNIIANFTKGGISGSYIGIQETNSVKYKYKLISGRNYWLTRVKNFMKYIMKV